MIKSNVLGVILSQLFTRELKYSWRSAGSEGWLKPSVLLLLSFWSDLVGSLDLVFEIEQLRCVRFAIWLISFMIWSFWDIARGLVSICFVGSACLEVLNGILAVQLLDALLISSEKKWWETVIRLLGEFEIMIRVSHFETLVVLAFGRRHKREK